MTAPPLHVSSFGGGVVLAGAADTRAVNELLAADGYDLGVRGALVCASDVSDAVRLVDFPVPGVSAAVSRCYGLATAASGAAVTTLGVTQGWWETVPDALLLHQFARSALPSDLIPFAALSQANVTTIDGPIVSAPLSGVQVTTVQTAGTYYMRFGLGPSPVRETVFLVNVGAREGTSPTAAPGLYALVSLPTLPGTLLAYPIQKFDVLGTGPYGSLAMPTAQGGANALGTKARQLSFRGIAAYNGHVFGWGFDGADVATPSAGAGEGPARLMFSNAGTPLVWGNDNNALAFAANGRTRQSPPVDRPFTDSDAIVLGDAGERIRAALPIFGKLFVGTNIGIRFVQGYGRDTFITNGAAPVTRAVNTVGPHAMIEGPDRQLYGVGDHGLWRFDGGGEPALLYERLLDYTGRSPGWFDCLWNDAARATGYPGQTNADLVSMAVDWERQQVLVVIPFCNAAAGYGPGSDTLVIRYHPRTGGFTRQAFPGVCYTASGYFRSDGNAAPVRFLGTATGGQATVQQYGVSAATTAARLPRALPRATFGPYAPFGPDGQGMLPRIALTLAWEDSFALPLVFRVTAAVDESPLPAFLLTVGPTEPAGPADGDCWCDTSGADPSLGNARSGATVPASGGALLKTWSTSGGLSGQWRLVPGQGAQGTRATLPLPLARRTGTRVTLDVQCLSARGRFQLEGLGLEPGGGSPRA